MSSGIWGTRASWFLPTLIMISMIRLRKLRWSFRSIFTRKRNSWFYERSGNDHFFIWMLRPLFSWLKNKSKGKILTLLQFHERARGGGGLGVDGYESDRGAKLRISVSIRMFRTNRYHFQASRFHLGLQVKKKARHGFKIISVREKKQICSLYGYNSRFPRAFRSFRIGPLSSQHIFSQPRF